MKIHFFDRTRKQVLRPRALRAFAERVLRELGDSENTELSLLAVSRRFLRRLNMETFGRDVYTDVIAFPLTYGENSNKRKCRKNENDERIPVLIGEVVFSPEQAALQCAFFGNTFDREVKMIVTHGILHLHGMEDESESGRRAMEETAEKLVEICGAAGRVVIGSKIEGARKRVR